MAGIYLGPRDLNNYGPEIVPEQLNFSTSGYRVTASKSAKLHEAFTKSAKSKTTIFLSHSHKDEALVHRCRKFFMQQGASVYVDWIDGGVPDTTSSETAVALKEQIEASRKFILLASENAKVSKWCPWELGYADKAKGLGNIAILPFDNNDDGQYDGTEYLGVYSRIIRAGNGKWAVFDADKTEGIYLSAWLERD